MVAQAAPVAPVPPSLTPSESSNAIKLLDLLTNRYHVGIIRESSDAGLHVEFPAATHLHAGQRVRFIVAGDRGVVAKHAMQRGFITQVASQFSDRLNVCVAVLPETAVA